MTDDNHLQSNSSSAYLFLEIVVKKTKKETERRTETGTAKTEKESGTDGTKTDPRNQGLNHTCLTNLFRAEQ